MALCMRAVLLALALGACVRDPNVATSTPAGGPRGLRASEHREVADQHDAIAAERARYPTPVVVGALVPELQRRAAHDLELGAHK